MSGVTTEAIIMVVALNFVLFSIADYIEQRYPEKVAAARRGFWGLFGVELE